MREKLRARGVIAAAVFSSLVAAIVPGAPAVAAGTGEFCGPGWQRITIPGVYAFNRIHDLDGVAGDLVAVGSTFGGTKPEAPLVERWDGSSWTASALPSTLQHSQLFGVARLSATDTWAVGMGDQGGADTQALAMRWNGSSWQQSSMPALPASPALFAVDGTGPGNVWAVGRAGSLEHTLILHWDGASWSVVPSPSPGDNATLKDVTAVSSTDAWAVGTRQDVSGGTSYPVVLRWNGASWTQVAIPSGVSGGLAAAGTARDGDLWTAGGGVAAGDTSGIVAHRQAGAWSTTATSSPASWTDVAPSSDTDVWVGGDDSTTAWSSHWDGTVWRTIAEPSARGSLSDLSAGISTLANGEIWTVGYAKYPPGSPAGYREGPTAMRLCPLDVTDAGISKVTSRAFQGTGTLWRFPASNQGAHDVTEALGIGAGGAPLFGTGARAPGTTGTFRLDHAGTFAVVDTTTGHTAELTVPTEALPKKASLGTAFTIYTSALTTLPSPLGTDIRYRKPGSEFWYRLVTGTTSGATSFTPGQTGVFTIQARLKNKVTGVASEWSPFAMINVT
jgi:hypothetical protein